MRLASRADVDTVLSKIILSDRQKIIFDMYYIRKLGITYTADEIGVCQTVVHDELKAIRGKIFAVLVHSSD